MVESVTVLFAQYSLVIISRDVRCDKCVCVCVCVCVYIYMYILRVLLDNAVVSYNTLRLLAERNMGVEHRWNGSDRGQPNYL